jgi:hypothetical protein
MPGSDDRACGTRCSAFGSISSRSIRGTLAFVLTLWLLLCWQQDVHRAQRHGRKMFLPE